MPENGRLAFPIRIRKIPPEMKTARILVVTLLAILIGFGVPCSGFAHDGTDHAAHRSQKARAVAKCRLKSNAAERKACFAKVKKRFGS